jgi:hypothetical protein
MPDPDQSHGAAGTDIDGSAEVPIKVAIYLRVKYCIRLLLLASEYETFYNNLSLQAPRSFYGKDAKDLSDEAAYVLILAFVTCNIFLNPIVIFDFVTKWYEAKHYNALDTKIRKIVPDSLAVFVAVIGINRQPIWQSAVPKLVESCNAYNTVPGNIFHNGKIFPDGASEIYLPPVPQLSLGSISLECIVYAAKIFMNADLVFARDWLLLYLATEIVNTSYSFLTNVTSVKRSISNFLQCSHSYFLKYTCLRTIQHKGISTKFFDKSDMAIYMAAGGLIILLLLAATVKIILPGEVTMQWFSPVEDAFSGLNNFTAVEKVLLELSRNGSAVISPSVELLLNRSESELGTCVATNFNSAWFAGVVYGLKETFHEIWSRETVIPPYAQLAREERSKIAAASTLNICQQEVPSFPKMLTTGLSNVLLRSPEYTSAYQDQKNTLDKFYDSNQTPALLRIGNSIVADIVATLTDIYSSTAIKAIGGLEQVVYLPSYMIGFAASSLLWVSFYAKQFVGFIKDKQYNKLPCDSGDASEALLPPVTHSSPSNPADASLSVSDFIYSCYECFRQKAIIIGSLYIGTTIVLPFILNSVYSGSAYNAFCFLELLFGMRAVGFGAVAQCPVEKAQDFMKGFPASVSIIFPTTALAIVAAAVVSYCQVKARRSELQAESHFVPATSQELYN